MKLPALTSTDPDGVDEICLRTIRRLLQLVDSSRFAVRVPVLRDFVEEHPGMHFHFVPDFLITLGGRCRLDFIHEEILLERDEMAVIPAGIPHREIPIARAREPFQNLVISIHNRTISVLHQHAESSGQTLAEYRGYFDSPKDRALVHYLEELSEMYHSGETQRHFGLKGLVLAYLGTLAGIIEHAQAAPPSERLKIAHTKRYVQEYLGSPQLCVKFLARLLHCSPDYLSYLFHQETGQRLTSYINQERVKVAKDLLRKASLSVSEVAFALGFESQAYFSRVSKQVTQHTPMDYRRLIERAVVELEGRPATIFAKA